MAARCKHLNCWMREHWLHKLSTSIVDGELDVTVDEDVDSLNVWDFQCLDCGKQGRFSIYTAPQWAQRYIDMITRHPHGDIL